ncbi:hypothetical protein FR483_n013L [Paramecium bursaria Chlorella virus FR483]|uniref:Uncharacterized protein n013L n=1 Tax=Paramecium bursaria Chlorella virus FR483 TaxID=399781 RepID=A7J667_PBCVF|nr:hypothetical protein FR483_n013L [Paramecium bursaria Chlorella virus FR483]ABT15298.1 hypothetical protein FR483_n013L [Paramecium bursaria Chlorella virus FR483]
MRYVYVSAQAAWNQDHSIFFGWRIYSYGTYSIRSEYLLNRYLISSMSPCGTRYLFNLTNFNVSITINAFQRHSHHPRGRICNVPANCRTLQRKGDPLHKARPNKVWLFGGVESRVEWIL